MSTKPGELQDVFERNLSHRLAEGLVPYDVMQQVSKDVDRYLLAVLQEAGIDPATKLDRLGALDPKPPAYAEPLVEVLERLAAAPRATAELGRLLDERIAARRGSPVPPSALGTPHASHGSLLLETVATFLRAQVKLPDDLLTPLLETKNGNQRQPGVPPADKGLPPRERAAPGTPENQPAPTDVSQPLFRSDAE